MRDADALEFFLELSAPHPRHRDAVRVPDARDCAQVVREVGEVDAPSRALAEKRLEQDAGRELQRRAGER